MNVFFRSKRLGFIRQVAVATFTADGAVTASYGAVSTTVNATAVSLSWSDLTPPFYVGVGMSLTMALSVTPSNAPLTFTVPEVDDIQYAAFDNWDAVDGYLTLDGLIAGATELIVSLPDGTVVTTASLEAVSVVYTPLTLAIPDDGTTPIAFSVAITPDDAPVTFAVADPTMANLGGTAPSLNVTGLAAGQTVVQALLRGMDISDMPLTVGAVQLACKPYLLADGQDTGLVSVTLFAPGGGPAAGQQVTLSTTDGTLYAVGDTPQNGGTTLVVTSDNNGCASAMLQSSSTPNVETITGSYTDASSTLHTGTATVTFFQPYLQSSGVSAPGPLATPFFAAAVGNATDTVSVTLTSNPPIDLTQVTVTWDPNSDGALDTNDPTGATWLSRAPNAKNLDNVSVSVQASVTSATCPAQIAIVSVTGIAPATTDASGLFASDSTGHNLVTGVQSGVTATVQAGVQPALSALPGV